MPLPGATDRGGQMKWPRRNDMEILEGGGGFWPFTVLYRTAGNWSLQFELRY